MPGEPGPERPAGGRQAGGGMLAPGRAGSGSAGTGRSCVSSRPGAGRARDRAGDQDASWSRRSSSRPARCRTRWPSATRSWSTSSCIDFRADSAGRHRRVRRRGQLECACGRHRALARTCWRAPMTTRSARPSTRSAGSSARRSARLTMSSALSGFRAIMWSAATPQGLITVNGVPLHEQSYLYPGDQSASHPPASRPFQRDCAERVTCGFSAITAAFLMIRAVTRPTRATAWSRRMRSSAGRS